MVKKDMYEVVGDRVVPFPLTRASECCILPSVSLRQRL